jgi:hypothetical protein
MNVMEAIEYFVSRTDGCFSGGATINVLDRLKQVADLNFIKYDDVNKSNISFIFKEAFHLDLEGEPVIVNPSLGTTPLVKYDIESIRFAYAVAENTAKWVREQKGE